MRWLSLLLCFALMGCVNPIAGLLVSKSAKEKEIAALKADYEGRIGSARQEVNAAKDKVIAGKDAQMVGAANSFYGQSVVFSSIHTPTRTDLLFDNLAKEGHAAIGNVPPTPEAMKAMNERLRNELDETKTSLSQLQNSHQAALAQNTALAEQARKHIAELAAAEVAKTKLEADYQIKLAAKQTELIETQNTLIAAEKARADDRAALQALKTKMSIVLGILALVGIAAAIYNPFLKQQCGLFGAVCGLVSIGIWWVQPWHVAIAAGAAIIGVLGWVLIKHGKEERVADALSLAFEDIKEKGGSLAAAAETVVKDRLSRYRRVGGKLVTEPNTALEQHIDQKLASYDHYTPTP